MRLLTWNCFRGDIDQRVERLRSFDADLIALQECRRPPEPPEGAVWRGTLEQQGVAVVSTDAALRIEALGVPPGLPSTVLPVIVHSPEPFILINMWAFPDSTYEAFAMRALSMCAGGVSLPMVVMGDFNSTPIIESQRRTSRELLRRLQGEFGLVSAYHTHLGVEHGRELHATFFMNRQENRPFHLDYCFVPERWAPRITDVRVGSFDQWQGDSDHTPLVVDLEL